MSSSQVLWFQYTFWDLLWARKFAGSAIVNMLTKFRLVFAPLSEIYGRLPVYHVCNMLFIVFTIACALATNLNMLIVFRFLAGTFGSAPLVNGGGSIADLIVQEKRGAAMAAFAMGPIIVSLIS